MLRIDIRLVLFQCFSPRSHQLCAQVRVSTDIFCRIPEAVLAIVPTRLGDDLAGGGTGCDQDGVVDVED